MITRQEVEARGRNSACIEDHENFLFSRVQGKYWIAMSKDDDGIMPHALDGFWESWITSWVINNVPAGSYVADLGANVGFYTFQLSSMDCIVDAFEPNPQAFMLLSKSVIKNNSQHINLYNLAVSDTIGNVELIVPRNNPMNSSLHRSVWSPNGEDRITVQSIDQLRSYDFIKIDIEGAEINVFNILSADRHPFVLMEFGWKKYKNPLLFAERIFKKYESINFINYDGIEENVPNPTFLSTNQEKDWMLVLRKCQKQ